jgi:hypothetical protein
MLVMGIGFENFLAGLISTRFYEWIKDNELQCLYNVNTATAQTLLKKVRQKPKQK